MTGALRFLALVAIGAGMTALVLSHTDLASSLVNVGVLLGCWAEIIELREERDAYRRAVDAVERQLTRTRNRA